MIKYILTISCALVMALMAVGCSEDATAPEAPGAPNPDPYVDVPPVPEPASPGGSVPSTSTVLSNVMPLASAFNPRVDDARGAWVEMRVCGEAGVEDRETWDNAWGSEIPQTNFGEILVRLERILLQNDTGAREPVEARHSRVIGTCGLGHRSWDRTLQTAYQGSPLQNAVYVRRDRHWELQHIENVGDYLLLDPNTQGEISSKYTQGVSDTQTQEFGQSLTAEVGLGIGPMRASVSGTLSRTFSTAVEVTKSEEQTFTKTVWGEPGKQIQFMVWELVEVYTLCDENGEEYTDPNYKLSMTPLERRGAALKLQATQFDQ